MLVFSNLKMAITSLRQTKWRSFLTMLGIIIGVASVITTVSLGEGIKQQVVGQINHLGADLITIRPGKTLNRDANGNITGVNLFSAIGAATLTEADLKVVQETSGVKVAVPLSIVTGLAEVGDREFQNGVIVATTNGMPEILNQKIQYGSFFNSSGGPENAAVIGRRVAEELFAENNPIGQDMRIRGKTFVVRGVFEEFPDSPLTPTFDYNRTIFMPYETGKKLSDGNAQIAQVFAKPDDPDDTEKVSKTIQDNLKFAHAGQEDFTVLRQEENLAVAETVLNLITRFIAGVAAISLLVGGIGIMNIMLVSVTERTHEIGIRKAIGATSKQILGQFLTEAIVLSVVGGLIGVIASALANYFIRIFTNFAPVITLPVILISTGVSMAVGIIFGVTPALRAARKDPIQALREI